MHPFWSTPGQRREISELYTTASMEECITRATLRSKKRTVPPMPWQPPASWCLQYLVLWAYILKVSNVYLLVTSLRREFASTVWLIQTNKNVFEINVWTCLSMILVVRTCASYISMKYVVDKEKQNNWPQNKKHLQKLTYLDQRLHQKWFLELHVSGSSFGLCQVSGRMRFGRRQMCTEEVSCKLQIL